MVSLAALLQSYLTVAEDVMLSGLSMDSRVVVPGDLFLACRGHKVHGASFIEQAVQAGAAAVLVDSSAPCVDDVAVPVLKIDDLSSRLGSIASSFYGEPSSEMELVAVTGTNGKTTVTHLLAHALNSIAGRANACGVIGTLGHGVGADMDAAVNTTPGPVLLQSLLRRFRQHGADYAVLEASSHALAQHRLDGTCLKAAVLTQVGRDHLDYHESLSQYAACKQRLFNFPELEFAVLNADDSHGVSWARQNSAREVFMYGTGAFAGGDISGFIAGRNLGSDRSGGRITIVNGGEAVECCTRLMGSYNLVHVLAAAATLCAMGFAMEQAVSALATAPAVPGRMEAFSVPGKAMVVVDYAHNPDALQAVLTDLRKLGAGRVWCVFGCGGDRDKGKRPLMGAIAARLADEVIITSDNPRGEKPEDISRDIVSGIEPGVTALQIADRAEAISYAINAAAAGDVVLVAGKGHELTQDIGGRLLPFSDRLVVQRQLGLEV